MKVLVVTTLVAAALASACGTTRPSPLRLSREPYMGVRCPGPNSIACDRVGLAVWLDKPAERLSATIDGMPVRMKAPATPNGYYEGWLQPAGMTKPGPMHVTADRGKSYWEGRHPHQARVHLVASYRDGNSASTTVRVWLHAGWG